MGYRSILVLSVAAGVLAACAFGCAGADDDTKALDETGGGNVGGSGGTAGTGGQPSTGGALPTGGVATGGAEPTGGVATGGAEPTGGADGTGATMPELHKFVGNIDTRGSIRDDFATYWDQFSPENAGKWESVQRSEGSFNWNSLDAMHDYCVENHILFKEHCFVWGRQQPGWVNNSNGESAVKEWMGAFCDRYPDTPIIDVVNEPPPHTTPAYKDGIGGDGSTGWDWIANAFMWAREACPNAVLILNDYNNIELSGDTRHTIDIVQAIQSVDAPIDAIGCQSHGTDRSSASSLESAINNLAQSTGLPVYITEYDLNIADDNEQQRVMQEQFTMFWNNENVAGITYWGYIEGATWQTNTGLMSSSGQMRPAMTWLMDFLGRP